MLYKIKDLWASGFLQRMARCCRPPTSPPQIKTRMLRVFAFYEFLISRDVQTATWDFCVDLYASHRVIRRFVVVMWRWSELVWWRDWAKARKSEGGALIIVHAMAGVDKFVLRCDCGDTHGTWRSECVGTCGRCHDSAAAVPHLQGFLLFVYIQPLS